MPANDIGIDMGTSSCLVYSTGKGLILKEPTVVVYDKDTEKIKAIGEEAKQMAGHASSNIEVIRPIRQGVITDFIVMEKMLKYFIPKAMGRRAFRKPRISICVPSGITEIERRAVEEATFQAGAREVFLVEEPIAAAIGAGVDVTKPFGNLIVDIGGGTTDVAVISLGGANTFCSTLVDRIVPGRIRDPKELAAMEEANGYHDAALDVGEVFGVWVIEGPAELEDKLPFKKAGVNVMVVPDVTPYKKRKVRILNGAHTGFVLGAYLAGFDIVRDCMHNDTVRGFMNKMLHEEIIPTLPLDKKDLEDFASAVEDRFNNPFVNHELMSISLNSTSKWKARNMPSFLAYIEEQKQLPKCLTMSLAAYIAFYSNDIQERTADGLICKRPAGNTYKIQDDAWALDFYYAHKDDTAAQLVHAVLTNTQMWDQDLTKIEGLEAAVLADLEMIRAQGAEAAYKSCL